MATATLNVSSAAKRLIRHEDHKEETLEGLLKYKGEKAFFNNGKGEILHTRHNNGGFVASSSFVDYLVKIGRNVAVLDYSEVSGKVEIIGNVILKDEVKIISYDKKITIRCTNGSLIIGGKVIIRKSIIMNGEHVLDGDQEIK